MSQKTDLQQSQNLNPQEVQNLNLQEVQEDSIEQPYIVPKGTENMVHLSIVKGRRFNPRTGKEESEPFKQMFTFAEWQLFKNNYKSLGYIITAVLNDPYGDAKQFVAKD